MDYDAITASFTEIANRFPTAHIAYPMIGAGLAGGDWSEIAPRITNALKNQPAPLNPGPTSNTPIHASDSAPHGPTPVSMSHILMRIEELPEELAILLKGRDLIVFDGVCVLCSGFFRFMVKHDKENNFHFATAQSPLGQQLYTALNLPTDDYETNLVITKGQIYQRLDAFAAAMQALGLPYSSLSALRHLPGFIKDPAYHLIARNRYRLFGRQDTCLMPDAALKSRFLELPT